MASKNNCGIVSIVNFPARSAKLSSCPRSLRVGVAKMYIDKRKVTDRIIHDLCKYTPRNWAFPAPIIKNIGFNGYICTLILPVNGINGYSLCCRSALSSPSFPVSLPSMVPSPFEPS